MNCKERVQDGQRQLKERDRENEKLLSIDNAARMQCVEMLPETKKVIKRTPCSPAEP